MKWVRWWLAAVTACLGQLVRQEMQALVCFVAIVANEDRRLSVIVL